MGLAPFGVSPVPSNLRSVLTRSFEQAEMDFLDTILAHHICLTIRPHGRQVVPNVTFPLQGQQDWCGGKLKLISGAQGAVTRSWGPDLQS